MSDPGSGSEAGQERFPRRRRLRPADPGSALPAGGWPIRRWASPGSSTCWRRACTATAMTGARATAPSPRCSRSCRCAPAAGGGALGPGRGPPLRGRGWKTRAGSAGAGPLGRGGANTGLSDGIAVERVGKLRLEAGTLLKSRNFGPSLQVGEHNLHFVSKVRSW